MGTFNMASYCLSKAGHLFRKLPLRVVLTVPFVGIVLVTVGLTGFLAFVNGHNAVNDIADRLYKEVAVRIVQRVDSYLAMPSLINQLFLDSVRLELVNVKDADNLARYFRILSQRFDSSMSICYADEQKNYLGVARAGVMGIAEGEDRFLGFSGEQTLFALSEYRIDVQGHKIGQTKVNIQEYNPRTRPWYQAAVQATGFTWTPIYFWTGGGHVGFDLVAPVHDKEGQLMGVLDTSLTLQGIDDFLKTIHVSEHGQTFIIDRPGLLVASSTIKKHYTGSGDKLDRLSALAADEPLVRASTEYMQQQFKDLANIQTQQQLRFDLNGQPQFLQVCQSALKNDPLSASKIDPLKLRKKVFLHPPVYAPGNQGSSSFFLEREWAKVSLVGAEEKRLGGFHPMSLFSVF